MAKEYGRFSQVQEHAHPLSNYLVKSGNHLLPGEVAATILKVGNVLILFTEGHIVFGGLRITTTSRPPSNSRKSLQVSPAAYDFVVKSGMASVHQTHITRVSPMKHVTSPTGELRNTFRSPAPYPPAG